MTPTRTRPVRPEAALAGVVVLLLLLAGSAKVGAAPTSPVTADLPPLEVDDPAVTSGMAWHLDAIGARVAWRSSLGATVRVAVVDTGVDSTHPDLLGQVDDAVTCIGAAGAADACTPGGIDEDGHGTHVAGIIAARADDTTGVAGVAPRARILAVKALQADCDEDGCTADGDAGDLAAGVRWAIAEQADIVNLSVSAPQRLAPELLDAIGDAWEAGAVIVLAAGKTADQPMFFDTSAALVVTATDREGNLAPHAPRLGDEAVAVAAPGGRATDTEFTCHETGEPVGIVSSVPVDTGDGSGYACMAGTSMAAAQVSGGLALLLSMGFSRDEALDRLIGTAVPGDGLARGVIDLAAAVATPYPPGVRNRHDAFATGVAPPPPTELPSAGPFSVPSEPSDPPVSVWVFMLGGAVGLAVVAEVVLRLTGRRRSDRATAPEVTTPEGATATSHGSGTSGDATPSHPPHR